MLLQHDALTTALLSKKECDNGNVLSSFFVEIQLMCIYYINLFVHTVIYPSFYCDRPHNDQTMQ
eukprot:m.59938 g.59938  ORF g.59938 m.59938 type:complete len:64 (+) comp11281_c0_seq1:3685-3876(+)